MHGIVNLRWVDGIKLILRGLFRSCWSLSDPRRSLSSLSMRVGSHSGGNFRTRLVGNRTSLNHLAFVFKFCISLIFTRRWVARSYHFSSIIIINECRTYTFQLKLLFSRFFCYSLHLDASVNLGDDNSLLRLLPPPPWGKLPRLLHPITLARAREILERNMIHSR